jgi:glutamate formiminotransferase/formiminotetrahydrofolate cyclodeaminase
MEVALRSMEVLRAMVETGSPSSVSDGAVGALAARSAVLGAFLNVRINAPGLGDRKAAADYVARGSKLAAEAAAHEREILVLADTKLGT